jgi:hypothetical protein
MRPRYYHKRAQRPYNKNKLSTKTKTPLQRYPNHNIINDNPPLNLLPHSFKNTNHHDLLNFSFLSSPLPSF